MGWEYIRTFGGTGWFCSHGPSLQFVAVPVYRKLSCYRSHFFSSWEFVFFFSSWLTQNWTISIGTLNASYRVGSIPAVRGRRDGHDNRKQSGKTYDSRAFSAAREISLCPQGWKGKNNKIMLFNILFCSSTNLVKNSSGVCSAQFDLRNHTDDYGVPLELSKHFVQKGPSDSLL